ncbi:class IV adenylate cyclase [archaeon]|jgi:predicted adenylyl cyclase CyaB|nr:class IV adenylate cyclase [archaeon]MBT3577477.1 class IV adenylate cyclase [archaeon]MBT6820280.1 class IV adenylate cyclase [archaeon]MBT6955914.1 class IV adenylate cyclase [archaeon]MBT7025094.1 class IV adenylate cyclase [archaeon]
MVEIEAKIKLSEGEFQRIFQILGKPDFRKQKNAIYQIGETFFRIRDQENKTFITFKGKRQDKKLNCREEIEFSISPNDHVEDFFLALGFSNPFVYVKKRADVKFNDCIVCLDILSENGFYVEVEGDEQAVNETLQKLNLVEKPIECRSYQEILQNENRI